MKIKRLRFPKDIILLSVRWDLRYGFSYRDLEEMLEERGIFLDHTSRYRWVIRFTPAGIKAYNSQNFACIEIRQCKYLNNILEQDHRNVKRRTRPMLGSRSCRSILFIGRIIKSEFRGPNLLVPHPFQLMQQNL